MRIIITTGYTGGGHNRAANALKDYILAHDSEAQVDIIDVLAECSALLNNIVVKGYKALVTVTPGLFGMLYKSADKQTPLSDLINVVYSQCSKKIFPIIQQKQPDVIISCHAFTAGILAYMKRKMDYDVPIVSIVTDFIPHRSYVIDGVDAFVTASAEAKDILTEQYNIPQDRVFFYGHPIYDMFYEDNGRSREDVLSELGLNPSKPTVLIMAGSFGVTDILKIYEKLVSIDVDYQLIVITGKNKKLYDAFEKMLSPADSFETDDDPEEVHRLSDDDVLKVIYDHSDPEDEKVTGTFSRTTKSRKPTKLFFFVDNVYDYMHASDLIITKPGGLTTSESIACALPMAVFKAYPGQEEQNAALLADNGIAIILDKGDSVSDQIRDLMNDKSRLEAMREACRSYVRKNSCENIYELAKKLSQDNKDEN